MISATDPPATDVSAEVPIAVHGPSVCGSTGLRGAHPSWKRAVVTFPFIVPVAAAIGLAAAANRGFNLGDEGLYVLSYLHPREYLESSTQFQLPIGALWALWPNLQFLRLLKLVTLLAAGNWLGREVVRYATRGMGAHLRTLESNVIVSAITTSALAPYVWLPQTPGYNDLTVMAAYVLAASALKLCGGTSSFWPWLVAGSTWWILFLSKWPTATMVALIGAILLFSYSIAGKAVPARGLAFIGAGAALAISITQFCLAPVGDVLRGIRSGSSDLGAGYSMVTLLDGYRHQLAQVLSDMVPGPGRGVELLALGVMLVSMALPRRFGDIMAAVGFVSLCAWYWVDGRFAPGSTHIVTFSAAIFTMCVLAAIYLPVSAALRPRRSRTGDTEQSPAERSLLRSSVVIASFAVSPFVIAIGTNNDILTIAVLGLPFWLAAIVLLAARFPTSDPTWTRVPVGVTAALALVTCTSAVLGTWNAPYRQVRLTQADVELMDGPLHGLRVDATTAAVMDASHEVAEQLQPTAVVAVWELPGLVVATDKLQPRYAWLPASVPSRFSASLASACTNGGIILLIVDNVVSADEIPDDVSSCAAYEWRSAGLFDLADSREIRIRVGSPGTQILD